MLSEDELECLCTICKAMTAEDLELFSALSDAHKRQLWDYLSPQLRRKLINFKTVFVDFVETEPCVPLPEWKGYAVGDEVMNFKRNQVGCIVGFEGEWVRVEADTWFDALRLEEIST